MPKRQYGQFCGLARTLDLVGERWSLLIVRELLTGPKRFGDLLQSLVGIGPNLLSGRLKELEELGVVEKGVLPPPARTQVYQLTEVGRGLEPVIVSMVRWGLRFMGPWDGEERFQPEWLAIAMKAAFRPHVFPEVNETYEFRIDDVVVHLRVRDGTIETGYGPAPDTVAAITADVSTFLQVASGKLPTDEAVRAGRMELYGPMDAIGRMVARFNIIRYMNPEADPVAGLPTGA